MKKRDIIFIFLFIIIILFLSALALGYVYQTKECKTSCKFNYKNSSQECRSTYDLCGENCQDFSCRRLCSYEKGLCIKLTMKSYKRCKSDCLPQQGCLNNSYKVNEKFTRDCDICECKKSGQIRCKKDNFCNNNVSVSESVCFQSSGFYNALCNGPYFDIVCSQQKFCLCDGNFNYSCPESFFCLKNFTSPNKRYSTIEGWRTLSGANLGDIGVCAR